MMEYLEKRQLEEILSKRPRLKDKLADLQEEGIKLDLWMMESWTAGKKPLLLLLRMTYKALPGKAEYEPAREEWSRDYLAMPCRYAGGNAEERRGTAREVWAGSQGKGQGSAC